jgi:hypothetical protein
MTQVKAVFLESINSLVHQCIRNHEVGPLGRWFFFQHFSDFGVQKLFEVEVQDIIAKEEIRYFAVV